jgi:hypothetical protein
MRNMLQHKKEKSEFFLMLDGVTSRSYADKEIEFNLGKLSHLIFFTRWRISSKYD